METKTRGELYLKIAEALSKIADAEGQTAHRDFYEWISAGGDMDVAASRHAAAMCYVLNLVAHAPNMKERWEFLVKVTEASQSPLEVTQ